MTKPPESFHTKRLLYFLVLGSSCEQNKAAEEISKGDSPLPTSTSSIQPFGNSYGNPVPQNVLRKGMSAQKLSATRQTLEGLANSLKFHIRH